MRHESNKRQSTKGVQKLLLIAVCALLAFSSCRKEENTIALIKVRNLDGAAIPEAFVKLFPEPSATSGGEIGELIEEVEQFTDANGEATFDFTEFYEQGQAGFAVLNILVTLDTLAAEGIIKIDPELVNEEIIILQ